MALRTHASQVVSSDDRLAVLGSFDTLSTTRVPISLQNGVLSYSSRLVHSTDAFGYLNGIRTLSGGTAGRQVSAAEARILAFNGNFA